MRISICNTGIKQMLFDAVEPETYKNVVPDLRD